MGVLLSFMSVETTSQALAGRFPYFLRPSPFHFQCFPTREGGLASWEDSLARGLYVNSLPFFRRWGLVFPFNDRYNEFRVDQRSVRRFPTLYT